MRTPEIKTHATHTHNLCASVSHPTKARPAVKLGSSLGCCFSSGQRRSLPWNYASAFIHVTLWDFRMILRVSCSCTQSCAMTISCNGLASESKDNLHCGGPFDWQQDLRRGLGNEQFGAGLGANPCWPAKGAWPKSG